MKKIGFIGTGNLSQSIINGLSQSKSGYEIFLFDVLKEKADALAKKHKAYSKLIFIPLLFKSLIMKNPSLFTI